MPQVIMTAQEVQHFSEYAGTGALEYSEDPDEFAIGALARTAARGYRRKRAAGGSRRQAVGAAAGRGRRFAKRQVRRAGRAIKSAYDRARQYIGSKISGAKQSVMSRTPSAKKRRRASARNNDLDAYGRGGYENYSEADIEMAPGAYIQAVRQFAEDHPAVGSYFSENDVDTMAIVSWNIGEPFHPDTLAVEEDGEVPALYAEDEGDVAESCTDFLDELYELEEAEYEEDWDDEPETFSDGSGNYAFDIPQPVAGYISALQANQMTSPEREALQTLIANQNAAQFSEYVEDLNFVPGTTTEKASKLQGLYDALGANAVEAQVKEWQQMQNTFIASGVGEALLTPQVSHFEETSDSPMKAELVKIAQENDMDPRKALASLAENNPELFAEYYAQNQGGA